MGTKITSMSVGAIDPIAVTKRVFWRPTTTGTLLKTGDPVCYRPDLADQKKRTTNPAAGHIGGVGTTYAEGSQTATGRLFVVEEPLIDNIDAFAGIVKSLGPKAGADGDFIEIFKANSGAIVPANIASMTTVVNRTILAIKVGTRTLGVPTSDIPNYGRTAGSADSKVVAIAMEVRTTAGLCWVKLDENQFIHQGGNIDYEFAVPAGSGNVTANQVNLKFANTAGQCCALHCRTLLSGTGGNSGRGVYRFEAFVTGARGGMTIGLNIMLDINAGGAGNYFSPLQIGMRSRSSDPDLSADHLYAIMIDWNLTDEGGASGTMTNPPHQSAILYINTDSTGSQPKNFMQVERYVGIGAYTGTSGVAPAAGDVMIPVSIQNIQYYLVAFADPDVT